MALVDGRGDGPLLMVSGAFPPEPCGVGDYTSRLMAAAPASWRLFTERDWRLSRAPGLMRRLLRQRPREVVVQYPTQGYGWSLVPHLLVVVGAATRRYRAALALHEYSSLSRKAQIALAVTSHAASHVFFTTEEERVRARGSRLFSSRVRTSVIPILSNIASTTNPPAFTERAVDLAYFGHIRDNKGVETFLDVVAVLRDVEPEARLAIVGVVPAGYENFAAMVATRCADIGVTLYLGLDDDAARRFLADVRVLYLPFPDGVSARRGSVLAGFGSGALVATRIGETTPAAMRPAVIACSGTMDDVTVLQQTLHMTDATAARLQQSGRDYVCATLPRDWAAVAHLYDVALDRVAHSPC
jgi:glycosyltransferase involved in cell wall biosynthesis